MAKKIVVTKLGYNALTEENPDNLVYSSDYDTLKYYAAGTINVTASGSSAEHVLAHNLGYIPYIMAYVKGFAGANNYNLCPGYFANFSGFVHVDVYADATNVYFVVHTDYWNGTQEFRYKIFRNRVDL